MRLSPIALGLLVARAAAYDGACTLHTSSVEGMEPCLNERKAMFGPTSFCDFVNESCVHSYWILRIEVMFSLEKNFFLDPILTSTLCFVVAYRSPNE